MDKIVPLDNTKGKKNTTETLNEMAYKGIKRLIFNKILVPGQKLIYKDLANALNMSQTPIISALNRLDQEGFVAYENFRGFFIKPIDSEEIWNAFGFREAVEVYAVKQAIQLGGPKEFELLEEKYNDHEQYKPDDYTRKKFILDQNFHMQIAEMSQNTIIKYVLKRNFQHFILRGRLDHYDPKRMESSAEEHRLLIEKMKRKDILGSIDIIETHIHRTRDNILKCISNDDLEEKDYLGQSK
ncbi:MAG: GntR family transcriptional regulator [Deltaproteobacteria bacterium]|nr:GntR family transcriptional regulator [Deltaproteobacteria bacterium]